MLRPLQLRRAALSFLTLAASVLLALYYPQLEARLPHLVYLSGWLLLGLCLFLTAYNARKKLPMLPLGGSRLWLQLHAYAGLFTGVIFVFHLRFALPKGMFNLTLAALFAAVTVSGILGWWLSRIIPRRLATAGGEVPYERIPIIRRDLRLRAEKIALTTIPEAKASTLAEFYARDLAPAFSANPRFFIHLLGSRRPLNDLLAHLDEAGRYLSPQEQTRAADLAELVRARHHLDFHYANQLLLKAWLFVHIPLTYGLLLFAAVHIVVVYAFSGGAQ
ncbi:MAG: hypothetical protein NTU80_13320 [Verrucomicrobia bacterium]|nr:hypothetical protein [Verrucomicrobiota bacterium]